jgi:ketosteroid isomerase-like protein
MANPIQNTAETAETVLQIESEIMAAIKAKDASALAPMVAEEFVYRTHFGAESNKSEFLQSIAAMPIEIISLRGDELKVNVYGETAILTGVQRAEARQPEGEAEESVVAFTDVFVQRDGRWLLVLAYGIELPSEILEEL